MTLVSDDPQPSGSDALHEVVAFIKGQISNRVAPGVYRSTIQPIQPLAMDDLVLDLAVPSDLHRSKLTGEILDQLEELAIEHLGRKIQLRVVVSQLRLDTENPPTGTAGALSEHHTTGDIDLREKTEDADDRSRARSRSPARSNDHTFANFVIGKSNEFAHAAAVAASEAPGKQYTPLFIYGGSGLGKTHLLHAFERNVNELFPTLSTQFVTTEQYLNRFVDAVRSKTVSQFASVVRNYDVLLLDDIQFISGKSRLQEELFHTLNALYDIGAQVVISSDSKPDDLSDLEDRLKTRFMQGLVVDVQPPDVETRMAILHSLAERQGFWLPNDVAEVIAERISDNVRSLEGALRRVYAESNFFEKSITRDLAIGMLQDLLPPSTAISVDLIVDVTAEISGFSKEQLTGQSRKRALVQYRKIAMHLARELTDHSLAELGAIFDRDHTTVLYAIQSSEALLGERAEFYERHMRVHRAIQERIR